MQILVYGWQLKTETVVLPIESVNPLVGSAHAEVIAVFPDKESALAKLNQHEPWHGEILRDTDTPVQTVCKVVEVTQLEGGKTTATVRCWGKA